MFQGVLDQRLDDQQGNAGIGDVGRHRQRHIEAIGEARALDLEVAFDDGELIAQAGRLVADVEDVAKDFAEPGGQANDAVRCRCRAPARRCCAGC